MSKVSLFFNKKKLDKFQEHMNTEVREGRADWWSAQCRVGDYESKLHRTTLLTPGVCAGLVALVAVGGMLGCLLRTGKGKLTNDNEAFAKESAATAVWADAVHRRPMLGFDANGDNTADYYGLMPYGSKVTTNEIGVTKSGADWLQVVDSVHREYL